MRCALGQGIGVFPRNHQERKERRLDRDGKFGLVQLNAVKIVFHKKQRQCARPRISRKRDPFGDDEPRETAQSSDVALPLGRLRKSPSGSTSSASSAAVKVRIWFGPNCTSGNSSARSNGHR